jgi:MarR family transcriptional regulator, negative regulator of the multidrug operon emrRAB
MITAAREAVDLLVQVGNAWHFDGTRQGLHDRDWMALRFLARANRFSRTPSALAQFVGLTRATVSQMIKDLEGRGYLERRRSPIDKRSVTLAVTPQGEMILASDPIRPLVNAIDALELGANKFRDILRQVLDGLDTTQHSHHADTCRECIFLAEKASEPPRKMQAEFTCRFFRAGITRGELDLLCVNFERREGHKR